MKWKIKYREWKAKCKLWDEKKEKDKQVHRHIVASAYAKPRDESPLHFKPLVQGVAI